MGRIKYYLFIMVVFFAFVQCDKDGDVYHNDEDEFSEYTVYSAILNQGFEKLNRPLVVEQTSDSTSLSFRPETFERYVKPDGVEESLFEEVRIKSDSVLNLENRFNIAPRRVQLISVEALNAVFTKNGAYVGWEGFYKEYPDSGGYIRFSRVGFNNEKNIALVEYAHVYGGLGADGGFIYLEREGKTWQLKNFIWVWVS